MGRTVYLGKRVKDVKEKGLDTLKEVDEICKSILSDYKSHKITYRTAISRLNLLDLIIKKSRKLEGKKRKAYEIVQKYRSKLMSMRKK